jgi:hypothetical protein
VFGFFSSSQKCRMTAFHYIKKKGGYGAKKTTQIQEPPYRGRKHKNIKGLIRNHRQHPHNKKNRESILTTRKTGREKLD